MQLRVGVRCIVSPKYYIGENNLVREIVFQDGVVWIALFARLDSREEFAGQVRLMQSLQAHIPVPEVYAFSDERSELGGRYLLMEGICGLKAEAEYLMFGIPDRHWNQVLEQLGTFMARGMAVPWKTFQIEGHAYEKDSAFWIDPAQKNIQIALNEIIEHKSLFARGRYSTFIEHVSMHLKSLFAELLYLCNEFLHPNTRASDISRTFPSHLPSFKMENVLFDHEYNVKGIIGFSRAESVSTWDYFQYPLGLEDSFDDHPMTHTITWMRESFMDAWRRELSVHGIHGWDDMQRREKWCQKDKVALLYQFRTSTEHSSRELGRLLSELYKVDKSVTIEILFEAFIFVVCSVLAYQTAAWDGNLNVYIDTFCRLVKLDTVMLHNIAERGRYVSLRLLDQKPFPQLP